MKMVKDMIREELITMALTDPLTQVGNRRAFDEADASSRAELYASLDISGLKYINDSVGHMAGDALLQASAAVLSIFFGSSVFRLGGDEFAVRLTSCEQARGLEKVVECLPLLSYGLGITLADADSELAYWRAAREQAGELARRGERPRQLARVLGREVG